MKEFDQPVDYGDVWYWTERIDGVPITCHRYYRGSMAGDFHAESPDGRTAAVRYGLMGFTWLRGGQAKCELRAIRKLAQQPKPAPKQDARFRRAGER